MTRRAEPPEVTWARLMPFLGPVLGLTRVATLTGLDTLGVPVCMAVRPASRVLVTTQGKGLSLAAAKVGAVMEAAETRAAEAYAGPLLWGSTAALGDRYPLLETSDLPRFHQARPLGPDDPIAWIEGQEIMADHEARVWVPFELVHTHYAPAGHLGLARFRQTTRGLAAGTTRLEAISHALCELIEGDSNARMVEVGDLEPYLIDPDTVDDPACRAVLDACARANVTAVVIDTTGPLGLAAFQVGLLDREEGHRIVPSARGMGCHPSRQIALVRALTEAAQSRATLIGGAREDLTRAVYARAQGAGGRAALREMAKRAARKFTAVPTVEGTDALDDVGEVIERLRRAGLRHAVMVDLSPHPAIAVVRVLVPGLLPEPDL